MAGAAATKATRKKVTAKRGTPAKSAKSASPKKERPFGESPGKPQIGKLEIPEDQYEKLEFCVQIGMMFDDIAMIFDMSRATLRRRLREDEKLLAVYKAAKAKAHAFVANKLFEHIHRGNLPAIIFYLKVQAKWYERQVVEHSFLDDIGDGSEEIDGLLPELTDAELDQLHTLLLNAEQRAQAMAQPKTGKMN